MSKRALLPIALVFILFSLSSCSLFYQTEPSFWKELDFINLSSEEEALVKEQIQQRAAQLEGCGVLLNIRINKSLFRENFLQAAYFIKPDKLRIDTLLPGANKLLNLFLLKENKIAVYIPGSNSIFQGENSKENIEKITLLPVNYNLLISLLSGVLEIKNHKEIKIHRSLDSDSYYYQAKVENSTELKARLSKETELEALCLYQNRKEILCANFTQASSREGPEKVNIQLKERSVKLDISVETWSAFISNGPEESLFELRFPNSAKRIPLVSVKSEDLY